MYRAVDTSAVHQEGSPMSGKGDSRRPSLISEAERAERYEMAFGPTEDPYCPVCGLLDHWCECVRGRRQNMVMLDVDAGFPTTYQAKCDVCGKFVSWEEIHVDPVTPDSEFTREEDDYYCPDCWEKRDYE